jgi:polyhydroxyalkanoate synthesis regulator phasin
MDITEGIKKIFLAGVGAVATTGEAAKNLIDTLVEKGELTVEQGKILNEEMKKNAKEKLNKHVTVHVVNEFKDVYSAVDKMSREELEELKARLNEMTASEAAGCQDSEACDCSAPSEAEDCGCNESCENSSDESCSVSDKCDC